MYDQKIEKKSTNLFINLKLNRIIFLLNCVYSDFYDSCFKRHFKVNIKNYKTSQEILVKLSFCKEIKFRE